MFKTLQTISSHRSYSLVSSQLKNTVGRPYRLHLKSRGNAKCFQRSPFSTSGQSTASPPPPSGNSTLSWFPGVPVGFLGGFIGAIVGVGGGLVMIPFMVSKSGPLGFGMSQLHANATSLTAVTFTGTAAAISYGEGGAVDVVAGGLIALSASFTARIGAKMASKMNEKLLKQIFGAMVLAAGPLLIVKSYSKSKIEQHKTEVLASQSLDVVDLRKGSNSYVTKVENPFAIPSLPLSILYLLIGSATGFISGTAGIGGGLIMTSTLVLSGAMPYHAILGTSLLAMIPPAITGAFTHYKLGNVIIRHVPALCIGALVGSYIGGKVALNTREDVLLLLVAGMLMFTGVRTLKSASKVIKK